MIPEDISIKYYTYDLPAERIAMHPLPERDSSKLLVYKDEIITESTFDKVDTFLNEKCLLVYNNTQVINARLIFFKESGKKIEIFCLEPFQEFADYNMVMTSTSSLRWKCMVGGAASWKGETLVKNITHKNSTINLEARLIEKVQEVFVVEFSWSHPYTFAEVLAQAGVVPLPPYIKRKPIDADVERYQTIYAAQQGSVAAPTAGLHFTDAVFKRLDKKKIARLALTLHVGAGTFKPVTAETMSNHIMHAEWIDVNLATIEKLASFEHDIVAVGTTSLRTLETLYWLGIKALDNPEIESLTLLQWDPYKLTEQTIQRKQALQALISWMKNKAAKKLITTTQLLIVPGYKFKMTDVIITNFHQPHSTLLLLVAAAVGERWKELYRYALENEFRFLSYGDSNLIFIDQGLMVTDVPTGM